MESMQFYKDYFDNIGREMKQQKYMKRVLQREYENEPESVKKERRLEMSRMVREIEEMANISFNNLE